MSVCVKFVLMLDKIGSCPTTVREKVTNPEEIARQFDFPTLDNARGVDEWIRMHCSFVCSDDDGNCTVELDPYEISDLKECCEQAIAGDLDAQDEMPDGMLKLSNPSDLKFYKSYLSRTVEICDTILELNKQSLNGHTLVCHIWR